MTEKTCECECDWCGGTCDLPEGHHDKEEKTLFERVTRRGNIKAEFVKEAVEKESELCKELIHNLITEKEFWERRDKIFGEFK